MSLRWIRACVMAAMLAAAPATHSMEAAPATDDAVLEVRILRLAAELRCLVCQNQTLADSNADLAADLRREMRELARAGRSDEQIVDFLVQRYGDFILYRPPFKSSTALLWTAPFLLLLIAAGGLLGYVRRRSNAAAPRELTAGERQRAAVLLRPPDAKDWS